jgi:hypothetical protein
MMQYNIWIEGFHIQGSDRVGASFVGSAEGKNFRDAVINWYKSHPTGCFDSKNMTDWGCGLFPTEQEARRRFG